MPVQQCRQDGKPGYRWGGRGKCYTYPAGNDRARREAKRKAVIQGIAAGERPSAAVFTSALRESAAAAEAAHLAELQAAYESVIVLAATRLAERFAITAAADWQPPPEGALMTEAQLAALTASLNKKLLPVWTRVILDTVRAPLTTVDVEIVWDVKHPLTQKLLTQAAQRTGQRLGEAVQPVLREVIRIAYDEGMTVAETSARIRLAIADAAPWQADMLARTDLNSLSNGASKGAAQEAGMGFKTWLATLDDKTRPEHVDADGQTVPISDTFLVGGEEADYPGDPNLSDAMAANCRCTVAYSDSLEESESLLADGGGSIMTAVGSRRERKTKQARKVAAKKEAITASAVAPHHTAVVAGTWDGNAAMTRAEGAADYRAICAWFESGADLDQRQSWKFPHHATAGGPASANGVRIGLARIPRANIPSGDDAGVERHLRTHLNDFNKKQGNNAIASFDQLSTEDALAAMDSLLGPLTDEELAVDDAPLPLVAAARPIAFSGTAAIEGKIADDNSLTPRVLMPDSLVWPEMPVSFMAQTVTAEGHDGAEVAGRVDEFKRRRKTAKMREIDFAGEFTTPFGIDQIAPMVEDKTLRYVSVDLGATEWAIVKRDTLEQIAEEDLSMEDLTDYQYALGLTAGKIKAVTIVPTQALEGAMVTLTASAAIEQVDEETWRIITLAEFNAQEAIVASAAEWRPPRAWFETAELPGKMPLTVTEDGRVYGHLATWDSCHVSFLPSCLPPPKSPSQYAYFHVSELDTEEGDTVTVGKLMFSPSDGGHADRGLTAAKASQYYDRTGMVAAYLRVSDGAHGIWAAGSVNPYLSEEQREDMRREMRLHPPSGDWRPINGQYELICGLAVAVPGFPVPRATITVTASADGVELSEAIIASSGHFEPDVAAVAALERVGLENEDVQAEREMRALAARAEGMDALAKLVEV